MSDIIQNVATNIISGFLGVGKTTAILSLFANKPANEKWGVLVNEFGKIGIDGRVYQAESIAVKEIPGGCVCCAQGLPLQVAVNRFLRETRPDRLIIESSGIGHPAGVLKTLKGDHFKTVLSLKAGICLIDPRQLQQPEFFQNALFKEQVQLADILVANKIDLADKEALALFYELAENISPKKEVIATTTKGVLQTTWLDYPHTSRFQSGTLYLPLKPQSEQWQTHSFSYPTDALFDLNVLKQWLGTQQFIRLKGIIQTKEGCYLLNYSAGQLDFNLHKNQSDNYIVVINEIVNITEIEKSIKECLL